ncbi:MAG: hypothetical protein ABIJ97_09730 [Bacteroidota bacterium]
MIKTKILIRTKYLKFIIILTGFLLTLSMSSCGIFRKKPNPPVDNINDNTNPDNNIQNKYGVPANYR